VAAALGAGLAASAVSLPTFASREDIVASVAARNLADLLGIDLAVVPYDPVEYRITRDTVAGYVRQRLAGPVTFAAPAPAPAPAPAESAEIEPAAIDLAPASQPPTRVVRMSGMRATIAKRMHASLREMAQLTLAMDADMDAVVADRARRKHAGVTIGFTDYVVAAAARALGQHPNVNAQITADGIALLPDIHVGLAVALDDGLMVPVVRHADRLDLAALSAETTRLADAARTGSLKLEELEGGTFSVSALGMFGVDMFTPVINPPNVAILGVGRLRDDVIVVDGAITTTKRLTLSLTWDHRVIDGAPAAAFCKSIADLLADPSRLD
jgi:pyruvate dehydrogenase E2 component (dihydrolipoamide acetyltransferase)